MKKTLLSLIFSAFAMAVIAQYAIGHRQVTYQDPARANRDVPVEIYYPGITAGDDVAVQPGLFPVIAFGHGFMMGYGAYAFWKDQLVPGGYIVVFPTTEGGAPDHAAFGADLAFLIGKLKSEGTNAASPFYQRIGTTSAIMGHSMGGGASFLACENNTVPECMITFAAANTTPSSITAAAHINLPALIIAGEDDCVAPPADHQQPMFDSLTSECKVFIGVKNGAHCYFGDYNLTCTLGESTCNPVPGIDRADQLATTLTFTRIFLDYHLKNQGTWNAFLDSLAANTAINYQVSCVPPSGVVTEKHQQQIQVFPNPASDRVQIILPVTKAVSYRFRVINLYGQTVLENNVDAAPGATTFSLDLSMISAGSYQIMVETEDQSWFHNLIVLQ